MLDRRTVIATVAGAGAFAMIHASPVDAIARNRVAEQRTQVQTSWQPVPAQSAAREGMAKLPGGAHLWYWDTGGPGVPVVLLHPATGSGAIWGYQQPVLTRAGFRVIGYSRRGHFHSADSTGDGPGSAARDLHELMDYLKVRRFHLLGSAAGGFIVPDYALSHPARLLTITIANSLGGVIDPAYRQTTQTLIPPGFHEMPATFRELGPSYRAANPAGASEWARLERESKPGSRVVQSPINRVDWGSIERIRVPALLITSDADLYMPPSRARDFASHVHDVELAVVPEAGHSTYWEQPQAFNDVLLRFLAKRRGR